MTEESPQSNLSTKSSNRKAFKAETLLAGFSDFLNITEPATALLLSLISIIAGIIGGYFWLESRINLAVAKRTEPYEDFLKGMILVNDQEYDKSIPYLRKSFQTLGERFSREDPYTNSNIYPVVDFYLEAIVNTENPYEYDGDFKKISKILEEDLSQNAWQHQQIAWYHFRTNELDQAEKDFLTSSDKYAADDVFYAAGNSYWALSLISLAKDEIDEAINFYAEAANRDYGLTYESTSVTLNGMNEDWFFREIWRQNSNIEKNKADFLKAVKGYHNNRLSSTEDTQ